MFQTCIIIPLYSFSVEHDKVCSKMKQKVLERFHPSLPTTPPSEMNVADLQSQFLQMLQTVMDAFEQLPDSLSRLKQFFSQLVLPMGEGKVVPLVSPSTYENATTTNEVFRRQSTLWNCFSPHLLKMMSVPYGYCSSRAVHPVSQHTRQLTHLSPDKASSETGQHNLFSPSLPPGLSHWSTRQPTVTSSQCVGVP